MVTEPVPTIGTLLPSAETTLGLPHGFTESDESGLATVVVGRA